MWFEHKENAEAAAKMIKAQIPFELEVALKEEYGSQWSLSAKGNGVSIHPISMKEWYCSFYITSRMRTGYSASTPRQAFDKCVADFEARIGRMGEFLKSIKN